MRGYGREAMVDGLWLNGNGLWIYGQGSATYIPWRHVTLWLMGNGLWFLVKGSGQGVWSMGSGWRDLVEGV